MMTEIPSLRTKKEVNDFLKTRKGIKFLLAYTDSLIKVSEGIERAYDIIAIKKNLCKILKK